MVGLFEGDAVLLAENVGMLQRILNGTDRVDKRRKLRVNAGKSKVMVFRTAKELIVDFVMQYRVRAKSTTKCRIRLGEKRMEEVIEFKY